MPYTIVVRSSSDKPYCVVRMPDKGRPAKTVGCHRTRPEAERHLAALRINVQAKEK